MADYQGHLDELAAVDASVMALSTDTLEQAREIVEADHITYPIAYGLRVPEDAERIGAPWEEKRHIIQPAEFILGPDRRVLHATYSTGPIGRITATDAVSLLQYLGSRMK